MIVRNFKKDGHQYQSINEDSFTNKKGIDVTQAPPMRDFVFDATNLDVNLDGSLSLRKPLQVYSNVSGTGTYYLYDTVHYVSIVNNLLKVYPLLDNIQIKLRYKGIDYDYATHTTGLDISNMLILNTNSSSILYNVKINLSTFLSGVAYDSELGYTEVDAYLKGFMENGSFILEYTTPYIANLVREEDSTVFNPNTANYYTYAVKDTYNHTVNSVQGILAYTNGTGTKVKHLTETDNYGHYIISTLGKDNTNQTMYLKAFCNFNNRASNDVEYYCSWEYTGDGESYEQVPEFLTVWQNYQYTKIVRVLDESKLDMSLDASERQYIYNYRYVVPLNIINDENDLLTERPDVLKLNSMTGKTYRFVIYRFSKSNNTVLALTINKISNCTAADLPSSYPVFYKKSMTQQQLENEDFNISLKVPLDFDYSSLNVKFIYKSIYDDTVQTATLNNLSMSSQVSTTYKTVTISANVATTMQSLASTELLYNVKQCKIVLYDDAAFLYTVVYQVVDALERLDSSQTTVDTYVTGDSCRSLTYTRDDDDDVFNISWVLNATSSTLYEVGTTSTVASAVLSSFSNYNNFRKGNLYWVASDEYILDMGDENPTTDLLEDIVNRGNYEFNVDVNLFTSSRKSQYSMTANVFNEYKDIQHNYNDSRNIYYKDICEFNVLAPYSDSFAYFQGSNGYAIMHTDYYLNDSDAIVDLVQWQYSGGTPSVYNSVEIIQLRTNPNINNIDVNTAIDYPIVAKVSFIDYVQLIDDESDILNTDFVNTVNGNKLYYNYKIYSYGDKEFKNNIYISDSNSFTTSLLNTVTLPMATDSKVTALIPWRDYLIAASETALFLITPQGGNYYTSKIINTFIGIPEADRKTVKAVLNGVIFKSGSKIYSIQPSVYASNDSLLNIIDISKPVAPYILENTTNFAFTTEQYYFLCMANSSKTTMLKYEYATRIWTKHVYPIIFKDVWMNTIDDIRIISPTGIYYIDKSIDKIRTEYTTQTFEDLYVQYGDILTDGTITPFDFSVDTGQKSYTINAVKQFVETKLIFAIEDTVDTLPLNVDIYVDQFKKVLHIDNNTSGAFWKNLDTSLVPGSSFIRLNDTTMPDNIMKQMFLRYSGKGYTIRHVISGRSHSQFKFYVSYYRFKSTSNKQ